jgi:hypothetical protein
MYLDSRGGIWVVLELLAVQYGDQVISSRLAFRHCKLALLILFTLPSFTFGFRIGYGGFNPAK